MREIKSNFAFLNFIKILKGFRIALKGNEVIIIKKLLLEQMTSLEDQREEADFDQKIEEQVQIQMWGIRGEKKVRLDQEMTEKKVRVVKVRLDQEMPVKKVRVVKVILDQELT